MKSSRLYCLGTRICARFDIDSSTTMTIYYYRTIYYYHYQYQHSLMVHSGGIIVTAYDINELTGFLRIPSWRHITASLTNLDTSRSCTSSSVFLNIETTVYLSIDMMDFSRPKGNQALCILGEMWERAPVNMGDIHHQPSRNHQYSSHIMNNFTGDRDLRSGQDTYPI